MSSIALVDRNIIFDIKDINIQKIKDSVPGTGTVWYHKKELFSRLINKIPEHTRLPAIDQNLDDMIFGMCSKIQVVELLLKPSSEVVSGKVLADEYHPPGEIILLHIMESFHSRINQMHEHKLLVDGNPDFSLLGAVLESYKIPSSFQVKPLHQSVRVYEYISHKKSKRVLGFIACHMLDMLKPLNESRMHKDGAEVEFDIQLEGRHFIVTKKSMREFLLKKYTYIPALLDKGL